VFIHFFPIPLASAQDGFIQGVPKLAYWQVGTKSETIIVLHGGPAVQHAYLRPEFDELQEMAKVIYYDQRGCGQSG
jgi:proline iminopeptidase